MFSRYAPVIFGALAMIVPSVHGQVITIQEAKFGARPGNWTNVYPVWAPTTNTVVTSTVVSGYSLSSTANLFEGSFDLNPGATGTQLSEIQFGLSNDAWPGLVTCFGLGAQPGNSYIVSTLMPRILGNSGSHLISLVATLNEGAAIPAGSTWTIECFDDWDNSRELDDAFGHNIRIQLPGSPISAKGSSIALPGTVNFSGEPGSPDNSVFLGLGTVGPNQVMGSGVIVKAAQLSRVIASTLASEARVRLENSSVPGQIYTFQLSNVASTYTNLSVPSGSYRTWIEKGAVGVALAAGSTWRVEAYDDYDDDNGPDTTGTGINFEIIGGFAASSVQQFVQPQTYNLVDAFTSAGNGAFTETAASNHVLANFISFSGSYQGIAPSNWGDDCVIAITNSNHPGKAAFFKPYPFVGEQQLYSGAGIRTLTGSLVGSYIPSGSVYRFEFADQVPTSPAGEPEAAMFGSSFTLYSTTPPAPIVVSGMIHLADTGTGFFLPAREITYSISQGPDEIDSGVISATNPDIGFTTTLGRSFTGAVVLTIEGSTYLSRRIPIALNGSNIALGTVTLRNGDVNDDGEVSLADIDQVLMQYGTASTNPADLNASGEVDLSDIDVVIANYGLGDE